MNAYRIAAALIISFALVGCGVDPNYATPEATVTTYLENGPRLVNSIDIPAWNFTWRSLSKDSQEWFESNWEDICWRPAYREACGGQSNPEKAKMIAFGGAIADRGPRKHDTIKNIDVDGDFAEATFKKWDGTMYLVKEDGAWRVDGLFGVEEMASNRW